LNWPVFKNTLREIAQNKLRLFLLLVLFLVPLIFTTFELCASGVFPSKPIEDSSSAINFVLLWGCGTIGRQVSDGTLSLLFSRPLTTTSFVFSKWSAVAFASIATSLFQLAAEAIVQFMRTPGSMAYGDIWCNAAERIMICFGFSAVIVLLSALVTGIKDLGLVFLIIIVQSIASAMSQMKPGEGSDVLTTSAVNIASLSAQFVSSLLETVSKPRVEMQTVLSGLPEMWYQIFAYLAVITVSLSLAILLLNKRELPYGSD
jgi:ABC-type transport system involved in multi-copper enzyme maturation permease subunit